MRKCLALFDVSPFIYTGENVPAMRGSVKNFPTGGTKYFLNHLSHELASGSDVILCFDSSSFRKNLLPRYKSNRSPKPDIIAQLDMLNKFLSRVGICCLKSDGYEADDLIYTCVEMFRESYIKIKIYTADYDIAHNVSETVEFLGVNSNVLDVNVNNFQAVLGVPYNTITASKLFYGDKSDNIPTIGPNAGKYFDIYLEGIKECEDTPAIITRTREFMDLMLNVYYPEFITNDEVEKIRNRIDLVYPKIVDFGYDFCPTNLSTMSVHGYVSLLTTLNCSVALQRLDFAPTDIDKELDSYLREIGTTLSRGTYLVDNNIVNSCDKMDLGSFLMKGF